MRLHLVIVRRMLGQEDWRRNLGESARGVIDRFHGIWNCKILQETPSEATLSFETEKPEWPLGLDATFKDDGVTLVYAELCD
ncbi:hypothetical protein [Lysobacter sp. Hz 25]|uniref:hypothetical protein n=1 Tax=Lysobacter sp. Hz 25 TaxID=3383698 RepID=UPI0038D450AF